MRRPGRTRTSFAPAKEAAGEARLALAPMRELVPAPALGRARLVVSELFTDRLLRTALSPAAEIWIDVSADAGILHGTVWGGGGRPESMNGHDEDRIQLAQDSAGGERLGRDLVEDAVDLWGASRVGDYSCVWFVIRWY